jgi:hypothetical protein
MAIRDIGHTRPARRAANIERRECALAPAGIVVMAMVAVSIAQKRMAELPVSGFVE